MENVVKCSHVKNIPLNFYNLYQKCFNKDEREELENLEYFLKENKFYHMVVAIMNEEIIGGAIYDYFEPIDAGVIEYIFVDENKRGIGISNIIYNYIRDSLGKNIYVETNKENTGFWIKKGFSKVNINYIQPKLSPEKEKVEGLEIYSNCKDVDKALEFVTYYKEFCIRKEK